MTGLLAPTAVVPVAGVGTRLRPHTHTVPKALIAAAGKPILGHILDSLVEQGIERVVLVTGFMGDRVREYVSSHYCFSTEYVEQRERRGLGHAIHLAREHVPPGPLLIILGDTLFQANLSLLSPDGPHRVGVHEVDDPRRFGVVELEGSRVVRFVEKPDDPPSRLALVGVYYVTSSAVLFDCLDSLIRARRMTKGEYQLTDALQLMIERGERIETLPIEGWFDCGRPETLLEANRFLLERMEPQATREGSTIVPPVWLDPSCRIESSVVGPYASIAAGALVRHSIVRNSILGAGAEVEESLLESSLVGERARVRGAFRRLNVGDSSEVEFA